VDAIGETKSPSKRHGLVDGRSVTQGNKVDFEIVSFGNNGNYGLDQCVAVDLHIQAVKEQLFPRGK
jgi:hypothetical protein